MNTQQTQSHQPKKVMSARGAGDKAEFTSAKAKAERSFGVSQSDSPKEWAKRNLLPQDDTINGIGLENFYTPNNAQNKDPEIKRQQQVMRFGKNTTKEEFRAQNDALKSAPPPIPSQTQEESTEFVPAQSAPLNLPQDIEGNYYRPTGYKYLDDRIKNRKVSMYDGYLANKYLGLNLSGHLNIDMNANVNLKGDVKQRSLAGTYKQAYELAKAGTSASQVSELVEYSDGWNGAFQRFLLNNFGVDLNEQKMRLNTAITAAENDAAQVYKIGQGSKDARSDATKAVGTNGNDWKAYYFRNAQFLHDTANKTEENAKIMALQGDTSSAQVYLKWAQETRKLADLQVNLSRKGKKISKSKEWHEINNRRNQLQSLLNKPLDSQNPQTQEES
ncbi:hypothetical protein CQA49_09200 [Helicobacter sp. MIT 00-7814]|uniref:hypothetical protein n=1 Tax=unclassified Helicobacter TaxID=2593540 RepID=UPI000E1ECB2E|nr:MULTISPECIES: hypothetical protein [unclassified Helicobacter]RDU51761.1 hypothetical protein CQA49_09200 [Helicobacter sp. MIT 00-7814]RDU51772.1 hypothetical protein CQA37_09345 [Helicobacter sp. MIT 99-10781]